MNTAAHHVIFGTGAVGLATLDALRRRGQTVRMVSRSGVAAVPDGVEVIGGDARDPRFTTAVGQGAHVVYQTLNPPYDRWTEQFPALQAGVLAAAEATGARLVSMENVYMYGRPAGRPLTEDRDYAAHTKKGTLRGRMARDLLAAHAAGRVQVAIGRAADYFGPRGGAQSNLGDRLLPAALTGSAATVLGDPDQPHTYTYIPDVGEGLAVLGQALSGGPPAEQLDGVGKRQGCQLEHRLTLHVEGDLAGAQDPYPRAGVEKTNRKRRGGVEDVFTVVEDHQRGGVLEPLEQRPLAARYVHRGDQRVDDVIGRRGGLEPGQPAPPAPTRFNTLSRRPTAIATAVLPTPSGPTISTSRSPASRSDSAASSVSRPTSSADIDGRFPGRAGTPSDKS
jgi:hypothetical protein